MIDRDTALGHHLFKITQTERVGDVPPDAQQHRIERIVEALQDPGDARSKRLSRCLRFLHRAAKAYLSASNTTSAALARQNPVRRHPNKGARWVKEKYLKIRGTRN